MDDFNYAQSALFFSFNFNPNIYKNNNNIIYPLLVFQKEIPKDTKNFIYKNIFLLYIEKKSNKKENDSDLYSLCISQPLMKENSISYIENIIIKTNYYCCIYFEEKNIIIYLYYDLNLNKQNNNNKIKKKTTK